MWRDRCCELLVAVRSLIWMTSRRACEQRSSSARSAASTSKLASGLLPGPSNAAVSRSGAPVLPGRGSVRLSRCAGGWNGYDLDQQWH